VTVNRETIQIDVAGLNKIEALERKLNQLSQVARAVGDDIREIGEEVQDLGEAARPIATRIASGRRQRGRVRGAQGDPAFTAEMGRATDGVRRQLEKRADQINKIIRAETPELSDILKRRNLARRDLEELKGVRKKVKAEEKRLSQEKEKLVTALAGERESILEGTRQRRLESRIRSTQALSQRRTAEATRLGFGEGFSQAEKREARSIQARIREAEAAVKLADREATALKRTASAAGVNQGQLDRELRTIEATRRQAATEQGRLIQELRELGRLAGGKRGVAKTGEDLRSRLRILEAQGVDPSRFTAGVGGKATPIDKIIGQASSAANLRKNVEGAKQLLNIAENRVSALEREVRENTKISGIENKRLDDQTSRTIKLQGLQRKLNELRAGGAAGPGLQRAQALIGRLPGLEQAGNFAQFDRDAKRASNALLDVASASRLQTKASKDVTTAENRRSAATRGGEDLEFKLRELTAAGVDPRQLAASVGGKPAQLQKILGRAFSEASFGDPEKAAELLDIVGRRVTVLERELGLNKKIASEEEKRLNAAKQGFPSSPVRGTKEMPGSPAWQAQNFDKPGVAQMRLNKALGSGDVLLKKLETLRMKGVDTVQEELNLQNTLNTARNSGFQLSKNNLSALENSIKSAELFVSTEQKLTTELEKQFKLRKMAAGGSGPIRRDTLTGRLATFGDLELAGRMQLGGRGPDSAINQIVQTFNRTVGAGAQGGRAGQQLGLNDLAKVSKASARELELLAETLSMVRAGMRSTDKGFDEITNTLGRVNREIQRQDPDADFLTRRLGVRGGRAASEGLIGGAFPLLFGQGVGAAAGGALGGGLGGLAGGMLGFGLSLAGTALGTAFDNLIQGAQDTGEMLRDLTENFDQIKEAGLLASRGQEKLTEKLIEAGNKTAAYSIIQAELNNKLGVEGVSKLRAAADAGDRMQRAMAELGKQIEIFVAGPLTQFLDAISKILERKNLTNQLEIALAEAPKEAREAAQRELRGGSSLARRGEGVGGAVFRLLQGGPAFGPVGELGRGIFGQPTPVAPASLVPDETIQAIINRLKAATPQPPQTDEEKRSAATRDAETSLANAQRDLQVASKELESIDLLKGFQQQLIAVRREQEDIDRQSFEIRRDYERQIADIRENVENKVLQISQDNRRKEIEIIGKQGELRQAQIRLLGLELQGALAGDELAAGLADAVTTYLSAQLSAQDQIEQRRLQFELEISNQQIEVEKFKGDIAKSVSRLNLDTAERIQSINFGIARRNEDASRNNFELEKRIAELKIKASQRELLLQRVNQASEIAQLETVVREQPFNQQAAVVLRARQAGLAETDRGISDLVRKLDEIKATPAPPLVRPIAPVSAKGVSTAGIDVAANQNKRLLGQARDILDAVTRVNQGGDLQQFFNTLDNLVLGSSQRLESEFKASWDELRITLGETGVAAERLDNSFDKFFADFETRNEALRKAGKPFEQLSESQKALINGYREVAKELTELEQTQRFYTESQQSLNEQYTQARAGINELLGPTTEYDRLLKRFEASGGLGVDAEKRRELLDAALAVDALNEELRALNALNDIAAGWTDSFIQFNKELLTGKNLAESLTQFLESAAERSIDVFLEYTLRPIQEKMFKDLAKFLGFEPKEDPALRELKFIGGEATAIKFAVQKLDGLKDALRPATPVAAPAPANGIVPGPSSLPASQQIVPADPSLNRPGSQPYKVGDWIGPRSSLPSSMMNGIGGPDLLSSSLLNQIQSEGGFEDIADLRALPVQKMLQQVGRPFTQLYRKIESDAKAGFANTRQEVKKILAPNPVRTQQVLQRAQKVEQVKQNWNPIDAQWQERMNRTNPAPRSRPSQASPVAHEGVVRNLSEKVFKRLNNMGGPTYGILGDLSDYLEEGEREVLRKGIAEQLRQGVNPATLPIGGSRITGRAHLKQAVQDITAEILGKQRSVPRVSAPSEQQLLRPIGDDSEWLQRYMRQTDPPRIIPGVESQFEGSFLPGQGFDVSKLEKSFGLTASAGGIGVSSLPEDVRLRALESVQNFKVLLDKHLKNITDVSWLKQYTGQVAEYINKDTGWRRGRSPEEIGAVQTGMREAAEEMITNRINELTIKVEGASAGASQLEAATKAAAASTEAFGKNVDQAAAPVNANAQTQAAAATQTEDTANKQNEALKKFGQVAGASIQTLSGVAMAVGGAQMIGKGGTYNTLMGIAGIFGGISSVASGISGFGKALGVEGFAKGGRPDPYKPAWVGEDGMELWVPDRPGTIISNDNLDDVYVPGLDDSDSLPVPAGRYSRRDSGGFSAESSYDQSGAPPFYGRSVPYQRSETTREIDRLERVASNPRDLPPIKYETQQINQFTFVTPDQLEESNARTAKAARAQTIRELADSLKTRKRIGL
jgi:hypothetical protein